MIELDTLQFLRELKKNNRKEWFEKNRTRYEHAKKNFIEFASELIYGVSKFDPAILKSQLDPKKSISRINRDIRFSKDKSPYKTNLFLIISAKGKNAHSAAYYFHLEPDSSFLGGGVYMPEPNELFKIRNQIHKKFGAWEKILKNKELQATYLEGILSPETLSRIPKGFLDTSPAREYLKKKGFYVKTEMSDKQLSDSKVTSKILEKYKVVRPLIDFLNEAIA